MQARHFVREPSRCEECRIAVWVDTNVQGSFPENDGPVRGRLDLISPGDVKVDVLADAFRDDAVEDQCVQAV